MNSTNNQIKKNMTQAFETAHNFFQLSLENVAKITSLHLETSKSIIDDTAATFRNIAHVSNPQQAFAHVNQLTTTTVEKNIANCKDVYAVITETQNHVSKMFQSQFQVSNANADNVANWLTKFQATKFDTANSAISSLVKNANHAINAATELTNKATDIASNNFKSTTKVVENVVATAKKATAENIETVLTSAMKATDAVVEKVKATQAQTVKTKSTTSAAH